MVKFQVQLEQKTLLNITKIKIGLDLFYLEIVLF